MYPWPVGNSDYVMDNARHRHELAYRSGGAVQRGSDYGGEGNSCRVAARGVSTGSSSLTPRLTQSRKKSSFARANQSTASCLVLMGGNMQRQMTVERVTNRAWGIFCSLEHSIEGDDDRRASLKAHIATLIERGEHNTDKLTVDGLVYLRNLTPNKRLQSDAGHKS
jgi:hypothetical protein